MCGIVISGSSAFVRENLSPFTKDFRAEGRTMSVRSFFGIPSKERDQKLELEKNVKTEDGTRSCTQRQRHRRFQNHRRSSRTIFRPGKRDFMVLEKGKNAYSTLDSQAVSDPSTKRARRCLTWLIGREAVFSTWYGRKRNNLVMMRCSDNLIRAAQKVHYFWDLTHRRRIVLSSILLL